MDLEKKAQKNISFIQDKLLAILSRQNEHANRKVRDMYFQFSE